MPADPVVAPDASQMRRARVHAALRAIEEGTRLDDLTDEEIDTIIDAARDHRTPATSGDVRDLIEYLFGTDRNNDGPRVVDLCFTAFMSREKPNPEDGEKSDWFNDTKPNIDKCIATMKERLLAASPTTDSSAVSGSAEGLRDAQEDIAFLLARSGNAGNCMFGGKRWTGISSNALVSIAFGEPDNGLPSDSSDLAACYRAVMRLPAHRRTAAVFDHLEAGERHVEGKYDGSIAWAREASEWPGRATLTEGQQS